MRRVLAAVALACALGGCSTTTTINTHPQGAHLWVRDQYVGRSPQRVRLDDGPLAANRVWVRAELEGHVPTFRQLEQDPAAGWILLDTLLVVATVGLAAPVYVVNATAHRAEYLIELTPLPLMALPPAAGTPWQEQALPAEGVYPPPPSVPAREPSSAPSAAPQAP